MRNAYFEPVSFLILSSLGMAFPAEGVEGTYRNNIDHVAALLKEKHLNRFRLYNLSNRLYDFSKFDSSVINWCGFPDHHPPPLSLLFQIVHDMHDWLRAHPDNIAVIHCLVRYHSIQC
jgi:protein-tyrosine phosphatase